MRDERNPRILTFPTDRADLNRQIDLEILDKEIDQERAEILDRLADEAIWRLDWERRKRGEVT
jgi:hypothetical protein